MRRLDLAPGLELPADEAVTQKYAFIGRSGSGKSYGAERLAELFLEAGAQIIALDWVGIWWSLRLARDGKAPGFPHVYIFGGEHADVDLRPESGALMADLVVDKHISAVLDVMHFRKAERTRFATAFAEQFFHRKKTARSACHLFIEEAQAYLPQMVRGDEARMVGTFEDVGKVGRNYGIGTTLISQRPQAINKDVLNQVEVLLAFQTNGPQERKAIAGWTAENTEAGAAMIQALPTLHTGHALVWSPQWLRLAREVHISQRTTYDASRTPTQAAKAVKPRTLAPADLEALGVEIQATIEKAKADDPKTLKAEIARLVKALDSAMCPTCDQTIRRGHAPDCPHGATKPRMLTAAPVLTDADRALLGRLIEKLEALAADLKQDPSNGFLQPALNKALHAAEQRQERARAAFVAVLESKRLEALRGRLDAAVDGFLGKPPAPGEAETFAPPKITYHPPPTYLASNIGPALRRIETSSNAAALERERDQGAGSSVPAGNLAEPAGNGATMTHGSGARRMLIALAQRPQGLSRASLGVRAGLSPRTGTFATYLGRLRSSGHIEGDGSNLRITPAGLEALGPFDPLPQGHALARHWINELGGGAARMLAALVEVHPCPLTREELGTAAKLSEKTGTFATYLGRLRALELVRGSGSIVASDELV